MPFLITDHDGTHFHAEGVKGPFKIAKKGLTKQQREKYLAMCNGGAVKPQKLAEGGPVEEAPRPWSDVVADKAFAAAQGLTSVVHNALGPVAREAMDYPVAAVRSVVHGTPYADERSQLAAEHEADRPARPSVMATVGRLPGETPGEAFARYANDPDVQAEALQQAMMFAGQGLVKVPPAARVATAAEQAAGALRARGGTHAATEARFGMEPGVSAAETAQAQAVMRGATADPATRAQAAARGATDRAAQKEALASAMSKIAAVQKREGAVGTIPWRDFTEAEADAVAKKSLHLQPRADGGFVGAPEWVKGPAELKMLRKKLDTLVTQGAYGAPWYENSRAAVREVSHGNPELETRTARQLGNYSPQATPDVNSGWAYQQINRGAAEGAEASGLPQNAPKTEAQGVKGARILQGSREDLGPKAETFAKQVDPNQPSKPVLTVNDLWNGSAFGYPKIGESEARQAGFTDAMHGFMWGEGRLALERARAKGLLHGVVDPDVSHIQAAIWTAERENDIRSKLAISQSKAQAAGRPAPSMTEKEIKTRAAQDFKTVLDKYTGYETYEATPGRKVKGHMEGIQDLPYAARDQYAQAHGWEGSNGSDLLYQAQGMAVRPTTRGAGLFEGDVNPNRAARPMVSYESLELPVLDAQGKPIQKMKGGKPVFDDDGKPVFQTQPNPRKGLNTSEESLLNQTNLLRSTIDAQDQGAWHAVRESGPRQNAARVQLPTNLTPEQTKAFYARAAESGLNAIDTGGGRFTLVGKDYGGTDSREFGQRLERGLKGSKKQPGYPSFQSSGLLEGAEPVRGSFQSNVQDIPWGEEGSGQVTEHLLKNLTPRYEAQFDASPSLRSRVGEKALTDERMASQLGTGGPRPDIQRLRGMISEEGLAGLRAYVAKNGSKGLPAVLLPLIYEGMQPDQPQQHFQGGPVQRFDAGGAVQGVPVDGPPVYPAVNPAAGQAPLPATMPPPGWAPVPGDPTLGTPVPGPYDPTQASTDALLGQGQPAAPAAPPAQSFYDDRGVIRDENRRANGAAPVGLGGLQQALHEAYASPTTLGAEALQRQAPAAPAPAPAAAATARWQPPTYGGAAPPPLPPVPQVGGGYGGGGGASAEIASASKAFQSASDEKARKEEGFLQHMAELQQTGANAVQEMSQKAQERYQQRLKVSDAMFEELRNAKINPSNFFDTRESWQKVSMGIGMLLSGLGSGLTGQPNMAMQVIQSSIDRDIDAQKANLAKGQNLLSYYMKQTGDELTAHSLLKADLLDTVAAQIKAQELTSQSATVRATASMAAQQFRIQAAQARAQTSLHEVQAAQAGYALRMEQYKMQMMQQMLGAGPGAALNGDHTRFLQLSTQLGVHPADHISYEEKMDPVLDAQGQPTGDYNPQSKRVVWRLMGSPKAAEEANTTFANINAYRPDVEAALKIIAANPTGTTLLQNPAVNQALKQHMARVISGYEQTVGGVNRMPSDSVVKAVSEGLGNPGGVTDTMLGQSAAALNVVLKQLDQRAHSIRVQARY